MRLRALEVAGWGCISSLRIDDLPDGIIVLHGPNGIGKSSLVQALRSCLFDHDHNSQHAIIQGAVNWQSQATPRVTVEFETGGRRCRVSKAFSKLKDGSALLEEHTGAEWTVLARGKDANPKTRERIGVNKSDAGLFQLLWLAQGDVQLPEKVDGQLQQAVESILGTMITGRDIEFKAKLDKSCGTWFTPLMANKKDSPLARCANELDKAKQAKDVVEGQLREVDDALKQHEAARLQHPLLRKELDDADKELAALNQSAAALQERRHAHALACSDAERARQVLGQFSDRLQSLRELLANVGTCQKQLAELIAQRDEARQRRDAAQHAADQAKSRWQVAQAVQQQHQEGYAELDDRQQLVTLAQQQQTLETTLEHVRQLGDRQQDFEKLLAGPPAPSEKEIEQLRGNRKEAQRLQAMLDAEAIKMTLRTERPVTLTATLDEQPPRAETLVADAERTWTIRQHAVVQLPGVGAVTVGRGSEKKDLEEGTRRVASLRQEFDAALQAVQADAADPQVLDILAERRIHQATWTTELNNVRNQIQRATPQGLEALHRAKGQIDQTRRGLLGRHPDWETWTPTADGVNTLRAEYTRRGAALQQAVDEAAKTHRQADQEVSTAANIAQTLEVSTAGQEATLRSLQSQLQHAGTEDAAQRQLDAAAAEYGAAQDRVAATALSDEEQQIDSRVQAAADAVRKRRERFHDNEKNLANLLGKLTGAEGLHQKSIQAEEHVKELEAALTREQLQADAHRLLRETFERIRQAQVQRTVGPVNDRVIAWAKRLGIDEYRGLEFGDRVLPSGLQRLAAAADAGAVDLQTESYGRMEQLCLLIRLALGGLLAKDEPAVAIFDDPLAHADPDKHRRFLEVLQWAAAGNPQANPPAGALQIIILTCHPDRFDHLQGARHIELTKCVG